MILSLNRRPGPRPLGLLLGPATAGRPQLRDGSEAPLEGEVEVDLAARRCGRRARTSRPRPAGCSDRGGRRDRAARPRRGSRRRPGLRGCAGSARSSRSRSRTARSMETARLSETAFSRSAASRRLARRAAGAGSPGCAGSGRPTAPRAARAPPRAPMRGPTRAARSTRRTGSGGGAATPPRRAPASIRLRPSRSAVPLRTSKSERNARSMMSPTLRLPSIHRQVSASDRETERVPSGAFFSPTTSSDPRLPGARRIDQSRRAPTFFSRSGHSSTHLRRFHEDRVVETGAMWSAS